jgi:DeoR family fructose operon transcriptional repressor
MSGALPEERRLEIIRQVSSKPLVRADELARHFGVSVETIRRDLVALERDGVTRRVYGGVTAAAPKLAEPPFERRRVERAAQKHAMARLAVSLVGSDDMLVMDVGTSVPAVAVELPQSYRGRVLTNSLLVAMELAGRDGVEVMTSGGRIRPGDLACFGQTAEQFFSAFYGGKAFLGSGGVHPSVGLTDYYPDEIPARRIIIEHAAERYVLADSSKLNQIAFAAVCPLDVLTAIITDDGVDDRTAEQFARAGVELKVATVTRVPG